MDNRINAAIGLIVVMTGFLLGSAAVGFITACALFTIKALYNYNLATMSHAHIILRYVYGLTGASITFLLIALGQSF